MKNYSSNSERLGGISHGLAMTRTVKKSPNLNQLLSTEERQLDSAALEIGAIRIGGTDPDCLQPRQNSRSEVVLQLGIVRGIACRETLPCSYRPFTERRTDGTRHFTLPHDIGLIDRSNRGKLIHRARLDAGRIEQATHTYRRIFPNHLFTSNLSPQATPSPLTIGARRLLRGKKG